LTTSAANDGAPSFAIGDGLVRWGGVEGLTFVPDFTGSRRSGPGREELAALVLT